MLTSETKAWACDPRSKEKRLDGACGLVNAFFAAVKDTFAKDWEGHTAKTSRLLHGAGIVSMAYVMDELNIRDRARTKKPSKRPCGRSSDAPIGPQVNGFSAPSGADGTRGRSRLPPALALSRPAGPPT